MKKIIALIIASVLLVFGLAACGEESVNESGADSGSGSNSEWSNPDACYDSKTSAFYSGMNPNSFYFKMNFTEKGETCLFTQATNGVATTTLKDFADDSKDIYDIFDGKIIHHIDVDAKRIDSTLTENGPLFLFSGYKPKMFAKPESKGDGQFNGKTYYSETFKTTSQEGGKVVDGKNVYFFEGDKLVAVEIYENTELTMVMEFIEYSNTLPADIFLEAPADYTKGNIDIDVSATFSIPSEWWDDNN